MDFKEVSFEQLRSRVDVLQGMLNPEDDKPFPELLIANQIHLINDVAVGCLGKEVAEIEHREKLNHLMEKAGFCPSCGEHKPGELRQRSPNPIFDWWCQLCIDKAEAWEAKMEKETD